MNEIAQTNPIIYSFPPIASSRSKVLILGTIPGKESLRMEAYYAHGQNAFWKIIFALHELPFSFDYNVRKEVLIKNDIALWDVLKACTRESSLDNDIRLEMPNDLQAFLQSHPSILKIFFNGQSAAKYFRKYFPGISLPTQTLPSTSPAHAIKWDQKLLAWQVIKDI